MKTRWRHRMLLSALVCLSGVGLSAGAAWRQGAFNERYAAEEFGHLATGISQQIGDRLWLYQYGLRGARGAVISAGYDAMTRAKFHAYHSSRDVELEFPGARGFGLIRRVPKDQEAAFVVAARADGAPDFAVHGLARHDGDRYVILYIEPVARNLQAVGLDIASEANRRTAAVNAMRSGETTITAPITLVQASAKPSQSFLVLMPVYRPGAPTTSAEEREAALFGWVYTPLVMSEILNDIDTGADRALITVYDVTEPADGRTEPFFGETPPADALQHADHLEVYGRRWLVTASATPKFFARLRLNGPREVFLSGTALSLLLAALFYAFQENRQRRREALDKQALLAAIVENANDAIIAEDDAGRITGWNRAAEKIFGYPAQGALHRPASDFLWPGTVRPAIAALRRDARQGVATAAFDTIGRHEDGNELDLSVTAAPIISTDGKVSGVGFTIRDIRERRAAEKAQAAFSATLERQVAERTAQLETARKDLQTILDAVPSMIGYWDRNLINRVANRAYAEWFKVEPGKLPGRHIHELLGDELFERNRPFMEAALRGEAQTFERGIPRPDGKGMRYSLAHYLPDIVAGEVQGFYVLVHDISEVTEGRQRLADALRENEALLATIKLHALFTETAPDGTILEINDSLCRIIGYRRDELIGRNIRVLDGDVDDDHLRQMRRTLDAGTVWRGDLCNRAKDGSLHWFETIIVPFVDNEGQVTKFLSLRTDITARLATDKALLEAKRAAEAANAAKSAFLANMSHEIRTPLNAVIGLGHLLQRTALDDAQGDYVQKSLAASNSLLSLVDDILDLAKIEAGEMDIESVPFDLNALLTELKAVLAGQIEAKGLDFALVIENPLPPIVLGDPTRLRQILLNLLSNAVKFSDRGGIEIRVGTVDKSATEKSFTFRIRDTGIGIAPDVLPRLFTPFEQADSSTTRRFGGTGLGLSIVHHLAILLSGSVDVVSEEGQGSTFTVTLPLKTPPARTTVPRKEQGGVRTNELPTNTLEGVRILVVDDAAVNLEICSRVLAHYGADVTPRSDGCSALEALRIAPDDFDIVLTDVQMPGIDGIELARRIREELKLTRLPVIALSADVLTTERQRALQAGMNDFVLKPFDPVALVKLLRSHVGSVGVKTTKPGRAPSAGASRWSVVETIDGIDAAEAAMRLNRDGDLFMSVLARLLDDCRDLWDDGAGMERSLLAARLHKLRGSAGSVGATAIARLAGALEAQLSEGADSDMIRPRLVEIRAAIDDLREASRAALAFFAPTGTTCEEPQGDAIASLEHMLRRHDLAAIGAFTTLTPVLKARLSPSDFDALRRAIEALRFEDALDVLGHATDGACETTPA